MINRFFSGFGFVIEGKRVISRVPGLRFWILIPFLIDIVLLGAGVYFGTGLIQGWVYDASVFVFGAEGVARSLFYYPAVVVFWIVFLALYFYLIYILASVIASPFYGVIAEKTLLHLKAIEEVDFSIARTVRVAAKMFWVSLLRACVLLIFGAFLFVASFIPGLNILASFAVFVILALDSIDYGFEACGFGIRQRMSFFRKNWTEFCGMGSFLGLTAFVPGLILLVMPLAVVGSASLLAKNRLGVTSKPQQNGMQAK